MAWTGGVTRTTGDIITASQWNAHNGSGGDLDYLKAGYDVIFSGASPTSIDQTGVIEDQALKDECAGYGLTRDSNGAIILDAFFLD